MTGCFCTGRCRVLGYCPVSGRALTVPSRPPEDRWYPAKRGPEYAPPVSPMPTSFPPGQIQVVPPSLSVEDVRRVVREELERHARGAGM